MEMVHEASPERLALDTGISIDVIRIFLDAAMSCERNASLKIVHRGDELTVVVVFSSSDLIGGDQLDLTKKDGFIRISAASGCPGEQYCSLVVPETITDVAELKHLQDQFQDDDVIGLQDLAGMLSSGLKPMRRRTNPPPPPAESRHRWWPFRSRAK